MKTFLKTLSQVIPTVFITGIFTIIGQFIHKVTKTASDNITGKVSTWATTLRAA